VGVAWKSHLLAISLQPWYNPENTTSWQTRSPWRLCADPGSDCVADC
jgi:hypothetical protein